MSYSSAIARAWFIAVFAGVVSLIGQAAWAQPPAIDTFFRRPAFSHAALAPGGLRLAFLVAAKGSRTQLAVLALQSMQPAVVGSFKDADVRSFRWVNDQRLVFDLHAELTGVGRVALGHGLFAVNHDGSGFRQLAETQQTFVKAPPAGVELLPWNTYLLGDAGPQDSDHVFVVRPLEQSARSVDYIRLQRLNTVSGRAEEVDAPVHAFQWVLDARGALRAVVTREAGLAALHVRTAAGAWKKLLEFDRFVGKGIEPKFFGPDDRLYVQAQPRGDKSAVYTLDIETGQLSAAPLAFSEQFDLDVRPVSNAKTLLGIRFKIDAEVTQWLDANMKALQADIDKLLPRTTNRVSVPTRVASSFALIEAFSDAQPTLTYLFHVPSGKLTRLGSTLPDIEPRQMGAMDLVRYAARDGLEIPAYLTLPPGAAQKNLPMVVLVHGGPWTRGAGWQWDAQVQFLATRGYAVLQPEFRGSTGFGARHFRAGFKQWGLAMQSDVADGARWAIAQGIADPKRICIAGASYGGYAALMGLVNDPSLFRCGINWVGVTDISLLYAVTWSDTSDVFKQYGMPALVGDPVNDAAQLKVTSPIENAAKITQPLLLAYGAYDMRVPLVHGEKFRDAVKAHNTQVEWVVYDEGHGWDKPETQTDFWGRVERFLAKSLAVP